jgi:hypothetical protein
MLDPDEIVYQPSEAEGITRRKQTQMFLDVMLSPLGKSGDCGQPLSPIEVKGLVDFINLPLSDTALDRLDKESERIGTLSKDQVYIILALLYEAHEPREFISEHFSIKPPAISSIKHGHSYRGTWLRYWRSRGLTPPDFTKHGTRTLLDGPHHRNPL